MSIAYIAKPYDPDADPLARPLPQETDPETGLAVHVEMCARRYTSIMRGQHNLGRMFFVGVVAILAANNGPELLDAVLKF